MKTSVHGTDPQAAVPPIEGLDARAMAAAQQRLDRLTKPPGSLGRLEELAVWLAGVTKEAQPRLPRKTVVVAAADHGVAAAGVSAYPQSVTQEMVRNFLRGGAAINVLARAHGAHVVVVDAGLRAPVEPPEGPQRTSYFDRRIGAGTADMRTAASMSPGQAVAAVQAGLDLIPTLQESGLDIVATGDMGIGNTTAAAAITAAITGSGPEAVTGRGTGVDDRGLRRKVEAVESALARHRPDPTDGIDVLHKVGGFEIGVLAGCILGAAAARIPVVLDGFISAAAALIAQAIAPNAAAFSIAAHRSAEPGHGIALERLGLHPYLDLGLRLGEGTGAVLAFALVEDASRLLAEMATFDEASVSGPQE